MRITLARIALVPALIAVVAICVGYAFAGSADKLAKGIRIGGVDVGGLTPAHARALLAGRAASLAGTPVTFVAAGHTWRIRPLELGVHADWRRAVDAAARKGDGFGFVRGYRRLALRLVPVNLTPQPRAYEAAVIYEVGLVAQAVDRAPRAARLKRSGLRIELVHGQTGTVLDRNRAARKVVRALASFDRAPVSLPVRTQRPRVTVQDLAAAQRLDARVLAAPITLTLEAKRWHLSRWQLASLLLLQPDGRSKLRLGGKPANAYFAKLVREVSTPAHDAAFAVAPGRISIVPARPGLGLDVPRTTEAILAAAQRRLDRTAKLVVSQTQPRRSTADAKAMGITGLVSSYETFYGGVPNRIHNVQVVAHLVDDKLIAPGATFSFNDATGERTAAKGFLEAPVIINGELQTALGGGVCQVSTTVFNAAYEAGLPISARTNHALYISHYPLGRDATVNYPDVDLKFINDTKHWLLLRTFVGSSSLVVNLYGTAQNRRVETETAPLRVVKPPPVERTLDKTLPPGTKVVDDPGVPAQATSVRRRVYAPDGTLLYDTTWYSSYRAEPKLIRFDPKPKAAAITPGSLKLPQ